MFPGLRNFIFIRRIHRANYEISKATPADRKGILRLMIDVFYKTDPSSVYSKVSENPQISAVIQEMSLESLDEESSFVAKEKEKGIKVVGKKMIQKAAIVEGLRILCEHETGIALGVKTKMSKGRTGKLQGAPLSGPLHFAPMPFNLFCNSDLGAAINGVRPSVVKTNYLDSLLKKVKSKSEKTLLELWEFVSSMPPNSEKYFDDEKKVFEIRYLVVDPLYRNQGIATALVNSSIKEAAAKGHKFVRIDCTSHFTARIASSAGMDCIYEINYEDYRSPSGEHVFQNIIFPHTKILVFAKKNDL